MIPSLNTLFKTILWFLIIITAYTGIYYCYYCNYNTIANRIFSSKQSCSRRCTCWLNIMATQYYTIVSQCIDIRRRYLNRSVKTNIVPTLFNIDWKIDNTSYIIKYIYTYILEWLHFFYFTCCKRQYKKCKLLYVFNIEFFLIFITLLDNKYTIFN